MSMAGNNASSGGTIKGRIHLITFLNAVKNFVILIRINSNSNIFAFNQIFLIYNINKISYVKMALKNIWANKVRTFLTMLGIIIGISSVILIISVGNGATDMITSGLFFGIRTAFNICIIQKSKTIRINRNHIRLKFIFLGFCRTFKITLGGSCFYTLHAPDILNFITCQVILVLIIR